MVGTWLADGDPRAPHVDGLAWLLVGREVAAATEVPQALVPCVWFELYENAAGFWYGCAVVDGVRRTFDEQTSSGATQPVGVPLTWRFDDALHLDLAQPMRLPDPTGGPARSFRATRFTLVPETAVHAIQTFPEHPDLSPLEVVLDARPGVFLDDTPMVLRP